MIKDCTILLKLLNYNYQQRVSITVYQQIKHIDDNLSTK